ncbi:MAG TPA: hypothetical protein VFH61_09560 [Thermoleophilia bacterium]|nr:hypothetical protein [Thermoleophilia bacterium]
MSKPRVAFFDFACCEGCQIEMTNYGAEPFLELLNHVEIVEFREAMTETTTEPIGIAFVEGSFTRESDCRRLEDVRERAAVVIAYGQCACTGGINALKNHQDDYRQYVYGADADMPHLDSQKAYGVDAAIKVDYYAYGCPVNKYEVLQIVLHLLHGKQPVIPNYPVCVECKRNETVCRYAEGDHCMGMVARAGCGAPCPAAGIPCEACRGFVDNPNVPALEKVLVEQAGFTPERAAEKGLMFTANALEALS